MDELTTVIDQSNAVLSAFEQDLKGSGEAAQMAYRALRTATSALPNVGTTAAETIAKIRQGQDASMPPEGVTIEQHRAARIKQTHEDASAIIEKLRQASYQATDALEASLHEAIIPIPSKDVGTRTLARQDLQSLLAGATSAALPMRMISVVDRGNPDWTAELVGPHGRALMIAQGLSDNDFKTFKEAAVARLMQQNGGTERQRAAKAALAQFHHANVKGRITAFHQAARMRLS